MEKESENAPVKIPEYAGSIMSVSNLPLVGLKEMRTGVTRIAYDLPVIVPRIYRMKTDANPNPEKPTDQWVTGEEPMTGPQISYLQTLCREAGEEFDATLTKAGASKKIEELQAKTGRGKT
jgi:hypothetical protein